MSFRFYLIFFIWTFIWFFGSNYSNIHTYIENYSSKSTIESDVFSTKKIQEAEKLIKNEYYKFSEKSTIDIENGMITSLVESLWDKHSSYFPPKEAKEFVEVLSGDFEGIGAVIDEHIQGIIIRKIFPDSPAKKAWLQDGDIISKVGEDSLLGMSSEDAVKKIRGPKWSKAVITYTRWDNTTPLSAEVVRDTIVIPSTSEKMFTWVFSDVWYIEVAFFGERTAQEFQTSLENVTASWAKAIILDFRNNGWGYLDIAVDILSYMLPDNTLAVTTKETDPTKNSSLFTKKTKFTNTDIPIIMLINNLSASATEIVAGALQDYKRAIIVGEKSYGKWSVQEPFLLNDGSMLKITIAKWYTPKDKNIDHDGITPDISIPLFDRDFTARYDRQLENTKEIIDALLSTNASYESVIAEMQKKDFTK